MFRNKSVDVHQFAMVPKAQIPRSAFLTQSAHKTTFDAGYFVPVYWDEVLPGDSFNFNMTAFARLATPIFPIMDNMVLDSFFFFVPYRLLWEHWREFNGQQANPGDSTSYVVPQQVSPAGGYVANSLQDYLGLPTAGQITGSNVVSHCAFPTRAYNLIYNEWFRDENLQDSVVVDTGDGPDTVADYVLLRRGKRPDYFTSCLPFPQKGASVTIPLGTQAPIRTAGSHVSEDYVSVIDGTGNPYSLQAAYSGGTGSEQIFVSASLAAGAQPLYADLSQATAATINQLRQSFQIQKLLERDARGGTRYTEIVRAHFGVVSPDARQQRPEYLGGGSTPVVINPIAQTSGTGASGTTAPIGTLSAMGTVLARNHSFSQSFTEHGLVLGMVCVRADLTYQQGLHRMWSRSTRYDFYWPAFAMLGEQAVLNQELYVTGTGTDTEVFGYQERWAEYRYKPSMITGQFRSTYSQPLDAWHLAQKFTSLPTLGPTFIVENPPVNRVVAIETSTGQQFIFDSFFSCRKARPMPLYSVPGLIDHF